MEYQQEKNDVEMFIENIVKKLDQRDKVRVADILLGFGMANDMCQKNLYIEEQRK